MDHDTHQATPAGRAHQQDLLERLFELTVSGQQHSVDFARLQQQVHQGLLAAQPAATLRPAPCRHPQNGSCGRPRLTRKCGNRPGSMHSMNSTPNAAPARWALWLMLSPPCLSIQML